MNLVKISHETWDTAAAWEAKLLATGVDRGRNYTRLDAPGRWKFGFVGDLVFRSLLIGHGKKFRYYLYLDGQSHDKDFDVWLRDGRLLTVDVKTASEKWHEYFMMPEAQFIKHRTNIYVAVRLLSADLANVEGWATARDVLEMPRQFVKIQTILTPFDKLRRIDFLLQSLTEAEQQQQQQQQQEGNENAN